MTLLALPKETLEGENRVSLNPATVKKLVRSGAEVLFESGAGLNSGYSDQEYIDAGGRASEDRAAMLAEADIVVRLHKPAL